MPWAKLDDNFHAHPKTYLIGLDGCGLFTKALSYCAHYLTDGFLPGEWVYAQVPATRRNRDANGVVERLVAADMFREVDGGFMIDDYLDCNPSRDEVEAHTQGISEKRRDAGRRGAASRWHGKDGKGDGKPMANAAPETWQSDGPVPIPTTEASVVPPQQRVAPAAAGLHPAFADVMAIAQEACSSASRMSAPLDSAILATLNAYPGVDHLRGANLAAADVCAGLARQPHFHKILGFKLGDLAKAPAVVDRRSERDKRGAEDLAALQSLRESRT